MPPKLKKLIETCGDIEFSVNGTMYTIVTWPADGICITPQNADDEQVFQSADELLDGYLIAGVPLRDLEDQTVIRFYH